MNKSLNIIYLKNHEINSIKWDNMVGKAVNGLPYAYSWYLDIVHPEWGALISDDYMYVMPLTCGRKFGFYYLFQPIFTQQLGVFSSEPLSPEIVNLFLAAIPSKFKFIEINLNTFNTFTDSSYHIAHGITYQLDLVQNYNRIFSFYNTNTKRNLQKASKYGLSVSGGITANEVVNFYREHIGQNIVKHKPQDYDMLRKIITASLQFRIGYTYCVYNTQNMPVAMGFFIHTHGKSIALIIASNTEGKQKGAGFLMIDRYIRSNAEKNIVLDFEGSMLPGIARFYAGFGAKAYKYIRLKRNKLPFPVRLMKK